MRSLLTGFTKKQKKHPCTSLRARLIEKQADSQALITFNEGLMLEISQDVEKKLNILLKKFNENEGNIISILQELQSAFGYIPEKTVAWFSKRLDIPESRFFGIITFYAQFHTKPRGKNLITACFG